MSMSIPRVPLLHRAFIREVGQTALRVGAILVTIFFVIRLTSFLSAAANGQLALSSVFLLLLLKLLTYLDLFVPLVTYIAILLVLGRWINDNEWVVIHASGMGIRQLLKPALIIFVVAGGLVAGLSLYVSPLAKYASVLVAARHATGGIIAGLFNEARGGAVVYFVETYGVEGEFRNIFIFDGSGPHANVVVAATGHSTVDGVTGDESIHLARGHQYIGAAGDDTLAQTDFATYALQLKPRVAGREQLSVAAQTNATLLRKNTPQTLGELHWRLAKIAMLIVLILFALSLSRLTDRKSRFPNLLIALFIYFTYSSVLGAVAGLIRKGLVPPHASLWLVHLVFASVACYCLHRTHYQLPFLPRFILRRSP